MSKVIVALDFDDEKQLMALVESLEPNTCKLKVGKEIFTRFGPSLVKSLVDLQFDVFLDLKFHDIPNTVSRACLAACDLGVWMVNVHAMGGPKMLEAARAAVDSFGLNKPKLIAVTILTSFDQYQLESIGIEKNLKEQALSLAKLSKDCAIDGIVCSPQEASVMKQHFGKDFLLVTPGIRLASNQQDDQLRIMTPVDAIHAGSDYLVIGRPITQSQNPKSVLEEINNQIQAII